MCLALDPNETASGDPAESGPPTDTLGTGELALSSSEPQDAISVVTNEVSVTDDGPPSADSTIAAAAAPVKAPAGTGFTGKNWTANIAPHVRKKERGQKVEHTRPRWFADDGSLLPEHYDFVRQHIKEAAKRISELADFPHSAPFEERRAWAKKHGYAVGCMYQRCSLELQDSYDGQIIENIPLALSKKIMVFPELAAGDEGVSGKKSRRIGLEKLKTWIKEKRIEAVISVSVSRWFRKLLTGLVFIRDEIVDNGVRAVAKMEKIDSNDESWEMFAAFHLILAEKQVAALSEFVRMGHKAKFLSGQIIGACPLGYYPIPDPNGGLTKSGVAKTVPAIHQKVAALIVKHFEWVANGLSLSEGCRRWNQEVLSWPPEERMFAFDPRATSPEMSLEVYRNMLGRKAYRGYWEHGKRKNKWVNKNERPIQEMVGPEEIAVDIREHLRIVSDDLFERVQLVLVRNRRSGLFGPRARRDLSVPLSFYAQLTPLFVCHHCGRSLTLYNGKAIRCPTSKSRCPVKVRIQRDFAINTIIDTLQREVLDNVELVDKIVSQAQTLDRENNDVLPGLIAEKEKAQAALERRMAFMEESIGAGSADEGTKRRYGECQTQNRRLDMEIRGLRKSSRKTGRVISREEVEAILAGFSDLLRDAASGRMDEERSTEALVLIRQLTGGRVTVEPDPAKKCLRNSGRGRFVPSLSNALRITGNLHEAVADLPREIVVPLRRITLRELLADEVHHLQTVEGMSLSAIGRKLGCGYSNTKDAFKFWYESRGLQQPSLLPDANDEKKSLA